MITIDGKQIKLQIWDTVTYLPPHSGGAAGCGGGGGGVQLHGWPPEGGGVPLKPAASSLWRKAPQCSFSSVTHTHTYTHSSLPPPRGLHLDRPPELLLRL